MTNLRLRIRNGLAWILRTLPPFRGKGSAGVVLGHLLSDYSVDDECQVVLRMKHGGLMYVDIRNRTEQWVLWTGTYDNMIIERLCRCLEPGAVVLDVGANTGFYAIPLGLYLKKLNGTVYAFEPIKKNVERLKENISLNDLETIVHPVEIALGDEEGYVDFGFETGKWNTTGSASIISGEVGEILQDIDTIRFVPGRVARLDTLVPEIGIQRCDLVKIDVEGAEYMFLRGGMRFLQAHLPVIYGEFSSYWMRQYGHSFKDVASLVLSWGYRLYRRKNRQGDFVALEDPTADNEDVLMVPPHISADTMTKLGCSLDGFDQSE